MSRLIMWNLVTLDGFYDGATPWALDWHETIWGPELEALCLEQLRGVERLIFGRKTYEGMAAYWTSATGDIADFMNTLPKIVFSRTLESADWKNSTLVNEDAATKMRSLKGEGRGDMYVFGSGDLSRTLTDHDLFDEYRLAVAPVVLGAGKPLFAQGLQRKRLTLVESRQLGSGGVILKYHPAPS
jgi:dihydrofolate reductase